MGTLFGLGLHAEQVGFHEQQIVDECRAPCGGEALQIVVAQLRGHRRQPVRHALRLRGQVQVVGAGVVAVVGSRDPSGSRWRSAALRLSASSLWEDPGRRARW